MQKPVEITYDKYGRMNYHPDFHGNQKQPWTTTDQKFLIENYELMGPEEISFALERTIHTVMTRAYKLRQIGLMEKPKQKTYHKRTRPTINEESKVIFYTTL